MKLIIAISFLFLASTSFYSLSVTGNSGNQINLSPFENSQKILIVNIATGLPGNTSRNKIRALEGLYEANTGKLMIIAFPSNSFGHESHNDIQLNTLLHSAQFGVTFPIAKKQDVIGLTASPMYNWLQDITQNGAMSRSVKADFEKYLIDKHGNIIGFFSSATDAFDSKIQATIDLP
jgi:glutathione peroxidase